DCGDVRPVADVDPVAIEGALARRALAGDAGQAVGVALDEVAGHDAARSVGDDAEGGAGRIDEVDRDVATGALPWRSRHGSRELAEPALGRLAELGRRQLQRRGQA